MPLYTAQKHSEIVKKVLVDSADVTMLCREVDTDNGYVKLFIRNNNGRVVICKNQRGESEALIATIYGKVEVILHDLPQQLMDAGGVLED